jgi:hypothetical protein
VPRSKTPIQKQQRKQQQQQHDPKVLGDAHLLHERVITLKWLRMVCFLFF